MKLITLNVEIDRHYDTVWPFLDTESPDVICLQEATDIYINGLIERGYHVASLPRVKKLSLVGDELVDSVLIATKRPHKADTWHYYHPGGELQLENKADRRETNRQGLVAATFTDETGTSYTVLTTHFTLGLDDATASHEQEEDMEKLLKYTNSLSPHIFAADLNIPRQHNALYSSLIARYIDAIPPHEPTSMDRDFHTLGSDPEKSFIFDSCMVDYILTQPQYKARNVRLQFGISDHAAVIADIHKAELL